MLITCRKLILVAALLAVTGWTLHCFSAERASGEAGRVSLYVTVEKDGNLIQGLKEGNFRLYQDGEAKSFDLAEPEKPASIALLVEHSEGSWFYFNDIQRAMEGFLNAAPEGHWYALATFAQQLRIDVDFTKQKGKIVNEFSSLRRPMWDEVNTYDAVFQMLDKMSRLPGRRILVLIGSGFDTFSSHTLEDVQNKLESTNVVFYGVGAGSALRGYYQPYLGNSARMDLLQAEAFLRGFADKSGGQAWFPKFESAFPDVMKGIMQSIESQYRLVYRPDVPADGKLHKIEVNAFTVTNDQRQDFEVRVRDGWRYGA